MSILRAFTMPKWGIEMTEGTLGEWNIKEGETVSKGQVVAQIETDKIVNEVQSDFDITFVRLIAQRGDIYPVGALLAVMSVEHADAGAVEEFVRGFRSISDGAPAPAETPTARPATAGSSERNAAISPAALELSERLKVVVSRVSGSGRGGRVTYQDVEQAARQARTVGGGAPVSIGVTTATLEAHYASPAAKRLALEHRVNLVEIKGSGPRGRISRFDVANAAGVSLTVSTRRGGSFESVRMSPTRKAIARQLTLSKSTIPHFYLRAEVNLEALVALRADRKRSGLVPSVNDYIVRAAALALAASPDVNIQVHGEEIRRFKHVDLAVAVDAERGLLTPVVRAAETKSLDALSNELRALIERARAGKLRAEEIEGGSFTISNLGMLGIDQFDAIINPPQGAILAVGAARRRAVERDGGLALASTVHLSLSCDHRAIDGATGARFLAKLRELLESPAAL